MPNRDELRALQAPLKERYRSDPGSALVTLRAEGRLGDGMSCSVATGRALVQAGLHPATGGTGLLACSGDMLLQALVACAGVTLSAVATALGLPLSGGKLEAEGDLDFRGTLAVAKDAPVGFREIRLSITPEGDLTPEDRRKLLELTERYCVVYQTLRRSPEIRVSFRDEPETPERDLQGQAPRED
ncbi:MAG: OsmC family protein [Thermoanaerobaculia bacterium]